MTGRAARVHHQHMAETAMTPRVRQGLGLLVIAAALWILLLMLIQWDNDWKYLVLGPPTFVCLFGGLGLLAYGLLRRR